MFSKIALLPVLCGLALAGAAHAQSPASTADRKPVPRSEVPVQARMAMHVSALVSEDLKQLVPEDDKRGPLLLRMALVAKQEALSLSCDGYTLDQRRHADVILRATGEVVRDKGADKDAAAAQAILNQVLRRYNTLLGGELAQFAYDPSGFCTAGKEVYESLLKNPEGESLLALKTAKAAG